MRLSILTIDGSQWLSDEIDSDEINSLVVSLSNLNKQPLAVAINGMTHYFNRANIIVTAIIEP
jgi:hypothetical protein